MVTPTGVFADAVEMIARGLNVELDEIVFEGELGTATEDLDLGYMTIAKGMACGMHLNYVGMKDGKRLIEVATMTRLGYAMEPDWPRSLASRRASPLIRLALSSLSLDMSSSSCSMRPIILEISSSREIEALSYVPTRPPFRRIVIRSAIS